MNVPKTYLTSDTTQIKSIRLQDIIFAIQESIKQTISDIWTYSIS